MEPETGTEEIYELVDVFRRLLISSCRGTRGLVRGESSIGPTGNDEDCESWAENMYHNWVAMMQII